ncbi:MAG TPA: hypothetical protein VGO09_06315 [Flavisolibacter sp.]|nr:hypothetical protein [Flavisolibacter sp.]
MNYLLDHPMKLMDENVFIKTVNNKAREFGLNPLLLLSGIEGLYTFRNIKLTAINYEFLDSLILTIFALRIGDQFHSLAEQNLSSSSLKVRNSAIAELKELSWDEIKASENLYLVSFANIINGKSPVRRYHEKALEVAALEIKRAQLNFENNTISTIVLVILKDDVTNSLGLASLFNS